MHNVHRYYNEVRRLDRSGLRADQMIRQFVGSIFEPASWVDVVTAHRVYVEDGGKRFRQEHFLAAFPEFKPDVPLWLFERELAASGGIDALVVTDH